MVDGGASSPAIASGALYSCQQATRQKATDEDKTLSLTTGTVPAVGPLIDRIRGDKRNCLRFCVFLKHPLLIRYFSIKI